MTSEVISINQETTKFNLDQAYDQYVKQALLESEESYKKGNYHSYEDVASELMKDD